jgi:hypothetical protein
MKKYWVVTLGMVLSISLFAQSPFAVLMYDQKSEQKLEKFPPNRFEYAKAIELLKKMNAKAVVLKFFYDLPKSSAEDQALSKSLKLLPVFIQARILNDEKNPNPLNQQYVIYLDQEYRKAISGNSGWLPLSSISDNAFDLGFVDIRKPANIPLFEVYQGNYVKSLWYSVLQYVLPTMKIEKGYLINGNKKLRINEYGEIDVNYPKKDILDYISFYDLINGTIDKSIIENKVVIIGYDGEQIDKIRISSGDVKSHRVFIYSLFDIYDKIK